MGVVLNAPVSNDNLFAVAKVIDIPVIITVTSKDTDIRERLDFGTSIINVACAQETPEVVAHIRERFPDIPIIASGGKTGRSVKRTIDAGANAITYTPPSTAELFKSLMEKYREDD
ncbi:MAG: hydrolase, partial [Lachnospiraceae bacterium]|nr:hydrolase [Lachnospiraceae bacterium]